MKAATELNTRSRSGTVISDNARDKGAAAWNRLIVNGTLHGDTNKYNISIPSLSADSKIAGNSLEEMKSEIKKSALINRIPTRARRKAV